MLPWWLLRVQLPWSMQGSDALIGGQEMETQWTYTTCELAYCFRLYCLRLFCKVRTW
ncbi:hypothetical protein Mp_3g21210 [Marchantia polymorpha subsp. ruderalis]|uniref:Uncharacterized protein n=2 Tax=Marchantia polymorpha TaxID=3197 RepID=A0AAF6B360_MARPO|nr:hypothetical protein MARPO_0160s0016 [Marchantia polymorpha]BBN06444.1 hypothetical protein Mp_3g21210 [Marchantia polymorpha subsp. ruderalis]|eukprot:PTQ28564.1 hypothetical protein MARPO_0160s0016 [Marchantia polymorpha]